MNRLSSITDTDYGNIILNEIYGENKLKSRAEIEKAIEECKSSTLKNLLYIRLLCSA